MSKFPNIVMFYGNNEIEMAYKYWGILSGLSEKQNNRIIEEYNELFKKRIP